MAEAQTYLSNCILQRRSIYSNRTVSYVIVLLELLTVLLGYIDLSYSYFDNGGSRMGHLGQMPPLQEIAYKIEIL